MIPSNRTNERVILSPHGEIDLFAAYDLSREIIHHVAAGNVRILLDLAGISSVDTRFASIILHCASVIHNMDGDFQIASMPDIVFTEAELSTLSVLGVMIVPSPNVTDGR